MQERMRLSTIIVQLLHAPIRSYLHRVKAIYIYIYMQPGKQSLLQPHHFFNLAANGNRSVVLEAATMLQVLQFPSSVEGKEQPNMSRWMLV